MVTLDYKVRVLASYLPTTESTQYIRCDQLILRKISKFGATRCQILSLKCIKFDFGWGFAPDPAGGAYSAPPDPLAVFKGSYL